MANNLSRVASLMYGLLSGVWGYGNTALTGTAVLVLVPSNPLTLTDVAFVNGNTAATFIQIFDAASAAAVTLGTTVPTATIQCSGTSNSGVNSAIAQLNLPITLGLVIAATTTATGLTAPTNPISVGLGYIE